MISNFIMAALSRNDFVIEIQGHIKTRCKIKILAVESSKLVKPKVVKMRLKICIVYNLRPFFKIIKKLAVQRLLA
jgi:hypothetical protein